MRLKKSFFDKNTIAVAKNLLGKKIVRVFDNGVRIEAIITETEAYHGLNDRASHASRKKTERNKIMFDHPGLVYVYLVYGMHYCLNFVTMREGFPAAVLVRAIKLEQEIRSAKSETISGPGKVCRELKIDKSFYGENLATSKRIWAEEGRIKIKKNDIIASRRVGVNYAGESVEWLWNFKIKI
ncbi:DNA-3-methyladenine glycosylase [Candidatus Microgenomates bacterium]|nr:DNA-3-methyladenine glycosylase [Candidatus Microgenomates bacterium]